MTIEHTNSDKVSRKVSPKETHACEDCKYYSRHRCKLWQVKVNTPDDSHCISFKKQFRDQGSGAVAPEGQ